MTVTASTLLRPRKLKTPVRALAAALDQIADSVFITDREGEIVYVNRAFEELTGYPAYFAMGKTPRFLKSKQHDAEFFRGLWDTIQSGEDFRAVFKNRKRNGDIYFEEKTISPVRNGLDEITYFISAGREVTKREKAKAELVYASTHDFLTGCVNRRGFEAILHDELAGGQSSVLLLLDLDDFKIVNDTYGHEVGDDFLTSVSAAFRAAVGEKDVVARLGGDEFGVLLRGLTASEAVVHAKRLIDLVRQHVYVAKGHAISLTASAGAVDLPDHGHQVSDALAHADLALLIAKERGRNGFCLYKPRLGQDPVAASRLDWKQKIEVALTSDRFKIHCQPIVNLASGEIAAYELLLRLQDEDGSLLHPKAFLGVAERFGLIADIDRWVLNRAIDLMNVMAKNDVSVPLAVNLSTKTLTDPDCLAAIRRTVASAGLPPGQLIFEISERSSAATIDRTASFMTALRELGCRFAIDDFGVGYSSLSRLQKVPFDYLKVDASLVEYAATDAVKVEMLRAIGHLGRALGRLTIAEGVRDIATARILPELGISLGQGYYLGRPAPIERWLSGLLQDSERRAS